MQKKRINLHDVSSLQKQLREQGVHTVCESARCPNIGECFAKKIATVLIAGTSCTRACRFCAIDKGKPLPLDPSEPTRVASLVRTLGLKYAVITSVTRDDLDDGGAVHYRKVIEAIRAAAPHTRIEVLVPDFKGSASAAATVFTAKPDVFAHNLETVPSLYFAVRQGADYRRSLELISRAKFSGLTTKSGIMLGLGETRAEILQVMDDLRDAGCDILTLGQYLAPSKKHLPVKEHVSDAVFASLRDEALKKGFRSCASGTYVRSSYLADTLIA
jgi:lipoic acid synthetase